MVDPGDAGRLASLSTLGAHHPRRSTVDPHPAGAARPATVERLATALNRCFETFTADADTFAADAFFDLLPPFWRFQLKGPDAFARPAPAIAQGAVDRPHAAGRPDRVRIRPGARGDPGATRWRAGCCCARCATAASPRSSSTATGVGRRAARPACRRGARCCAATSRGAVMTRWTAPRRPPTADEVLDAARALAPTIAARASRGRGGPAGARRPARRARRRRLLPDAAARAATAASAPTCRPRCGCSRRWPRPTPRWPGR